jgi:hypothetical protein
VLRTGPAEELETVDDVRHRSGGGVVVDVDDGPGAELDGPSLRRELPPPCRSSP